MLICEYFWRINDLNQQGRVLDFYLIDGDTFKLQTVTIDQIFIVLSAIYTGCSRRNVPDFGRVFLMLKYTNITQNTYVQS